MKISSCHRPNALISGAVLISFIIGPLSGELMAADSSHGTRTNPMVNSNPQTAEDQFLLGKAYDRGEGVPQSYETAGTWYRRAAEAGNTKAMNNLGILFLEGQGTAQDDQEGYRWIAMAADKGDPRSQYLAGCLLCRGQGTPLDTTKGVALITKAAAAGVPSAVLKLGRDYLDGGDGVPRDRQKAIEIATPLAEQGNDQACTLLGEALWNDEGDLAKNATAIEWLEKGAAHGDVWGMSAAGLKIYRLDPVRAYPWLMAPCLLDKGNNEVLNAIAVCRIGMTEQAVKDGERRAMEILRGASAKPSVPTSDQH